MSGEKYISESSKKRLKITNSLLSTLDRRFEDAGSEFISATKIAKFNCWPSATEKEEIADFGSDSVDIINQFQDVISQHLDTEAVQEEWITLKSFVYSRYKNKVQELKWEDIFELFLNGHKKILKLTNLIISLSASSAENEPAFSKLKLIKTTQRKSPDNNTKSTHVCTSFNSSC